MRSGVLFVLAMLGTCVAAQQIPETKVNVRNSRKSAANFGLSCNDRHSWRSETLGGRKDNLFNCNTAEAKMWIHINTDLTGKPHQETEMQLENGQRYELFWNKKQHKWDVRKLS